MTEAVRKATGRLGGAKTVIFSLIPLAALLAAIEGGARILELWMPPRIVDLGQGFLPGSRLFVPDPDDPAMLITNPEKLVSFQNQRFARMKTPGTMRLFILGGSSVNYLQYELPHMAERLRQALAPRFQDVEIINCGGLSYGTHRLVLIAAEVLDYAPDALLIYSGHNEFEELEQLDLAHLRLLPLQRLLSHFAAYRFARDRIADIQIARLEKDRRRRELADSVPDTSRTWNRIFTPEEIRERMTAFERNLSTMIELCQSRRVSIIIGTVPSNLLKPNLPGEAGARYQQALALIHGGQREEGLRLARRILREAPRHQASDAENEIIRAVAARYRSPLADVEAAVIAAEPNGIAGETLFNDHCHLTPDGNRLLVAAYEREVRSLFGANAP